MYLKGSGKSHHELTRFFYFIHFYVCENDFGFNFVLMIILTYGITRSDYFTNSSGTVGS